MHFTSRWIYSIGRFSPQSFRANKPLGTQVITAVNASGGYSTEAIQNIAVGQTVLTKNQYDPNGPLQQETVTAVQVHTVYSLRDVTIKNADGTTETIDTTDSHPFYVQGQGWVSADDLMAGETLSTPDGQTATVLGTTSVAEPQGVLVYNFTVADDHTYFVEGFGSAGSAGSAGSLTGSAGTSAPLDAVWVHNDCSGAGGAPDESPRPNSGIAEAKRLGQEGEAAVGLGGPKQAVKLPSGATIIPDKLDEKAKMLAEVKNTAKQYFTSQLRSYLAYAKSIGWKMKLFVRPSTKLSGPLKEAIASEEIIVDHIPGIK